MKNEIIFSDLANLCEPKEEISQRREKDKWCSYSYETGQIEGTMLVSFSVGTPKDVILSPKLSGWYQIYVGLYVCSGRSATIDLKLSGDGAFVHFSPCLKRGFAEHIVEDVFWRCADMDGQDIVIGKHIIAGISEDACLAWVRFVPMTEDQVKVYEAEKVRTDTKRLYAANDMHNVLCCYDVSTKEAWRTVPQEYMDSDVEWLAVENLLLADGSVEGDVDDFMFSREFDKNFQKRSKIDFSYDILRDVVSYGQSLGLKMCVSMRIAQWGAEVPYDGIYFDRKFAKEHPEYRCVDRDGDVTEYLSFVYPQVQEYLIDEFVRMSKTGCDAVQPIFTRGWPFILFEEPFREMFQAEYGEDVRELPLDDERVVSLKCRIMTEFMRRLRKRLTAAKVNHPVELHAKVMFSMYDNKVIGLDLETWAKEGLVDRIVSDERRIREILDGDVWKKENPGKIDLKKYTSFVRNSSKGAVQYDYDSFFQPMADSRGILRGPATLKERIAEFMVLEKKYGVTVYIEIMPRSMNTEKIKEKALEIYEAGCDHIGLWDTSERVKRKCEWTMWRRLGHKEELPFFSDGEGEFFKEVRLLKVGGKSVRNYKPIWGG